MSTVALDVEAVKRAVAEGLSIQADDVDATATVSLDVAAVKQAAAQAPTVAFAPVDLASQDAAPGAEAVTGTPEPADGTTEAATAEPAPEGDEPAADPADPADPTNPTDSAEATASADLAPAAGNAVAEPDATTAYLASTTLTQSSGVVAVPETADDVIATIHAAATAVAAADRRARQAAVAKEDPWTGLDLHRPATPAPVGREVLDLLAPVLERPLLVVEQPGPPAPADVVALHRSELERDFVEPPVLAAGAEPPIPPRYGPGLSVLPHIEFPV